jgi:hypothetical protein
MRVKHLKNMAEAVDALRANGIIEGDNIIKLYHTNDEPELKIEDRGFKIIINYKGDTMVAKETRDFYTLEDFRAAADHEPSPKGPDREPA